VPLDALALPETMDVPAALELKETKELVASPDLLATQDDLELLVNLDHQALATIVHLPVLLQAIRNLVDPSATGGGTGSLAFPPR
jgi:hypothetical protein